MVTSDRVVILHWSRRRHDVEVGAAAHACVGSSVLVIGPESLHRDPTGCSYQQAVVEHVVESSPAQKWRLRYRSALIKDRQAVVRRPRFASTPLRSLERNMRRAASRALSEATRDGRLGQAVWSVTIDRARGCVVDTRPGPDVAAAVAAIRAESPTKVLLLDEAWRPVVDEIVADDLIVVVPDRWTGLRGDVETVPPFAVSPIERMADRMKSATLDDTGVCRIRLCVPDCVADHPVEGIVPIVSSLLALDASIVVELDGVTRRSVESDPTVGDAQLARLVDADDVADADTALAHVVGVRGPYAASQIPCRSCSFHAAAIPDTTVVGPGTDELVALRANVIESILRRLVG